MKRLVLFAVFIGLTLAANTRRKTGESKKKDPNTRLGGVDEFLSAVQGHFGQSGGGGRPSHGSSSTSGQFDLHSQTHGDFSGSHHSTSSGSSGGRPGSGFHGSNQGGGFPGSNQGGGFPGSNQGGGFPGSNQGGGFNQGSGFNQGGGGYNQGRPNQGSGFNQGFNQGRPNQGGGFNQGFNQGSYNRPNHGGFGSSGSSRPHNQGGFNQGFNSRPNQGGGFNRPPARPSSHGQTGLAPVVGVGAHDPTGEACLYYNRDDQNNLYCADNDTPGGDIVREPENHPERGDCPPVRSPCTSTLRIKLGELKTCAHDGECGSGLTRCCYDKCATKDHLGKHVCKRVVIKKEPGNSGFGHSQAGFPSSNPHHQIHGSNFRRRG